MDTKDKIRMLLNNSDKVFDEARNSFCGVLKEHGCKVGVELGVEFGGHIEKMLGEYGVEKVYGVDVYKENTTSAESLTQPEFETVNMMVKERLKRFGNRYVHLRKCTDEAIFDIREKLDFIYIDAEHTNRGTFYDIVNWYPLVKGGGIIGGHDYGHPSLPGVKKAVDTFFVGRLGQKVNMGKGGVWWVEKKATARLDSPVLSVAIPTYNSTPFIMDAINSVINDPRVVDIVVSDDNSIDVEKLAELLHGLPRVRLIRHSERLGGLWNKERAIAACRSKWVILLDSDNALEESYIDKLYRLPDWMPNTIYSPDYGGGAINYRTLGNMYVNLDNFPDLVKEGIASRMILDTGNFFLSRNHALRSINQHKEVQGHVPCSLMINYFMMGIGCKMLVVEGMEYKHRIHKNSYWFEQNASIKSWDDNMHKAIMEKRRIL
jgi:hypothetical protein